MYVNTDRTSILCALYQHSHTGDPVQAGRLLPGGRLVPAAVAGAGGGSGRAVASPPTSARWAWLDTVPSRPQASALR